VFVNYVYSDITRHLVSETVVY